MEKQHADGRGRAPGAVTKGPWQGLPGGRRGGVGTELVLVGGCLWFTGPAPCLLEQLGAEGSEGSTGVWAL